ncbi:MAG: hypothetical protein DI539_29595, partial [Flavobacterium psychrophilum]
RHGWAGVEIFFVISGFVIPYAMYVKGYQMRSFWIFLKKRIIRIEPPYLVSIILVLILGYVSTLSPYYKGQLFNIDWLNLIGHIGYLNTFTNEPWLNPVYWSLAIEFQYYILIALAYRLIVSPLLLHRASFFLLFAGLSFLPGLSNGVIFFYAPYFIGGILLFQRFCNITDAREFLVLSAINSILLWYQQGWGLMLLVALALLTIAYVKKVPAIFKGLGLISYSLYLIHVPIGGRIINISATLISSPIVRECIVIIAFAICIFSSWLFYKFIEKRFKRMSSNIRYDSLKESGTLVSLKVESR